MKKNVNKQQHVQLGGMAFYDESKCFLFAPNEHGGGEKVQGFRSQGVAQQLSDGTFDFVVKPRIRSQSELIRKLAHGRLSKTKDGAIQLTLKVFCDEGINYRQGSGEGGGRGCRCFDRIPVEAIKEVQLKVFDVQLNNSK